MKIDLPGILDNSWCSDTGTPSGGEAVPHRLGWAQNNSNRQFRPEPTSAIWRACQTGKEALPATTNPVTGFDSAQTEVAGNEKDDDDETDQPDDLIHGFSL